MAKKKNKVSQEVQQELKDLSQISVESETVDIAPVESKTVDIVPVEKPQAVAPEVKENVLVVNMKELYEMQLRNKKELPANYEYVAPKTQRKINLTVAFAEVLGEFLEADMNFPIAILRKLFLNKFCSMNELTPLPSKRLNKEENKANAVYGEVEKYIDKFDSDDNYRLFGFLQYPKVVFSDFVLVKYDVYLIIFEKSDYENTLMQGQRLQDEKLQIIS